MDNREFELFFGEVRAGSREVEASISSTYPGRRGDLIEILGHKPENIDLSRGPTFPINLGHNTSGVNIGIAKDLKLGSDGKLRATLKFGRSEKATQVWNDIKDGILKFVSVGYEVLEKTKPNSVGEYLVSLWRLLEISLVSVAMDPNVGIGRKYENKQIKKPSREVKRGNLNMREIKDISNYWKGNQPQFKTLQEQIGAVIKATNYREHDPRLRATGLSEGDFTGAGSLMQPELTTKFFQPGNVSELWTRATHIPLGNANQILIPAWNEATRAEGSLLGGIDFDWLAEDTTQSYSKPQLRQLNMVLEKCQALVPYTQELEDDGQAFSAVLDAGLQRGLNYMLEGGIIRGTGAGQPQGFSSSACKVTIAKEPAQNASTIVSSNIFKMLERIIPESYTNGDLAFVGHPSVIPEVSTLSEAIGTGGSVNPLWHWRQGGERHNKLCGLDFIISDRCETLGTRGDLYLVDLSSVIATYKPIKKQTSIHVLFLTDESVLKFQMRLNIQNFLAQAITPARGSNKLSTVIDLAERA